MERIQFVKNHQTGPYCTLRSFYLTASGGSRRERLPLRVVSSSTLQALSSARSLIRLFLFSRELVGMRAYVNDKRREPNCVGVYEVKALSK